jgi:hypothetical protein
MEQATAALEKLMLSRFGTEKLFKGADFAGGSNIPLFPAKETQYKQVRLMRQGEKRAAGACVSCRVSDVHCTLPIVHACLRHTQALH